MAELKLNLSKKVRKQLTKKQKKEITNMYKDIAQKMSKKANSLKNKNIVSESLKKQYLNSFSEDLTKEINRISKKQLNLISNDMLLVSNAVIDDNKEWLKNYGIDTVNAFYNIPIDVVKNVRYGNIYKGNWSLSNAIWSDVKNKQDDIQKIISIGIAENKSTYDIAKDLERYVNPSARKGWEWSKVYPNTSKRIDYNAQRLARTMVSHAYQQSVVNTAIINPFIQKIRWISANTERTCQLCLDRDGQLYSPEELPLDHPNGLCSFAPEVDIDSKVVDRLANWANGAEDEELDEFSMKLYNSDNQKNSVAKVKSKIKAKIIDPESK